jgi:hypothetical protein
VFIVGIGISPILSNPNCNSILLSISTTELVALKNGVVGPWWRVTGFPLEMDPLTLFHPIQKLFQLSYFRLHSSHDIELYGIASFGARGRFELLTGTLRWRGEAERTSPDADQ